MDSFSDRVDFVEMGLAEQRFHQGNSAIIAPNRMGCRLLALMEILAESYYAWYWRNCQHPNWIDEGHGGPDSGYEAGHCPDCGHGFCYRMY